MFKRDVILVRQVMCPHTRTKTVFRDFLENYEACSSCGLRMGSARHDRLKLIRTVAP